LTKDEEHENNTATKQRRQTMLNEIVDILNRSRDTVVEDAVGVISLFLMLFAGLAVSGAL
jgi:hypothetical protein